MVLNERLPCRIGRTHMIVLKISCQVLVNLDGTINGPGEPETGNESSRSAKDSKQGGNHSHVGEVDHHGQDTDQVQSAGQEPQAVQEEVNTSCGTVPKGLPPPAVIFRA